MLRKNKWFQIEKNRLSAKRLNRALQEKQEICHLWHSYDARKIEQKLANIKKTLKTNVVQVIIPLFPFIEST